MNITFDPCDLPRGPFLPAGAAWLPSRRGEVDPKAFGVDRWGGFPVARRNLIRDVATRNKAEALSWDH